MKNKTTHTEPSSSNPSPDVSVEQVGQASPVEHEDHHELLERVCHLSCLHVPSDETAYKRILGDLDRLMEFASQITNADVSGLMPLAQPMDLVAPFRDDETESHKGVEDPTAQAPDARGRFFSVPKVLDR